MHLTSSFTLDTRPFRRTGAAGENCFHRKRRDGSGGTNKNSLLFSTSVSGKIKRRKERERERGKIWNPISFSSPHPHFHPISLQSAAHLLPANPFDRMPSRRWGGRGGVENGIGIFWNSISAISDCFVYRRLINRPWTKLIAPWRTDLLAVERPLLLGHRRGGRTCKLLFHTPLGRLHHLLLLTDPVLCELSQKDLCVFSYLS